MNQKKIQDSAPNCELILATAEPDYVKELQNLLIRFNLRGFVLSYNVEKPDQAKSRIWNIACGREAIRKHFLSATNAPFLLFLDGDMTFDSDIVSILVKEIQDHDAVFSGASLKRHGTGLTGCGCVLLKRGVLEKLKFRCYEFKNGEEIFEDNVLEMDLFDLKSRIKKGFFLHIDHYLTANKALKTDPQKVGTFARISNNNFLRYCLIRFSIMLHYNLPWHLKKLFNP